MSLPQGTNIITEQQARGIIRAHILDPIPNVYTESCALDVNDARWSDRHSARLIDLIWSGMDSGLSLYVRPDFLSKPPVDPEPEQNDGYNHYIKE